ncbi:MAG TPA: hypothetical protein VNF73_12070 [Candidatus Saccharimonadales bacterium]|nr:hypothetical protein [Candidatus Saccharimonadales bacterium]
MPDIQYAFLSDAAEARPGQKFYVIGGGIDRIGGPTFPLQHPHLSLVIGLSMTTVELNREHEIRFVLLDSGNRELTSGTANITAQGGLDARDSVITFAVDLWNLTFALPGDYSFRLLVDGSERQRLPLNVSVLGAPEAPPATLPSGERHFDA